MTFKDASNRKSNQTARPENVVHLSNLCTEIIEVTSNDETAVCNLGSINIGRYLKRSGDTLVPMSAKHEQEVGGGTADANKSVPAPFEIDFEKLHRNVRLAVKQLDRVIDLN